MEKKAPALRSLHQKNRPARSAKPSNNDKREAIADSISTLENTIAAERDADRKQQERSERGKGFREWATIILLVVTAGFVLGQWVEMKRVYGPIAEQARYTRESYASVQRAFITDARLEFQSVGAVDITKNGLWTVRLTVQNSGPTPTRDLEYVTGFFPDGSGLDDPEALFRAKAEFMRIAKGAITIGPNAVAQIQTPIIVGLPSTGVEGPEADEPHSFTVMAGAIRYRDHFVDSPIHLTKFCFMIWDVGGVLSPDPCPHWNCSDDDCKSDKAGYDRGSNAITKFYSYTRPEKRRPKKPTQ